MKIVSNSAVSIQLTGGDIVVMLSHQGTKVPLPKHLRSFTLLIAPNITDQVTIKAGTLHFRKTESAVFMVSVDTLFRQIQVFKMDSENKAHIEMISSKFKADEDLAKIFAVFVDMFDGVIEDINEITHPNLIKVIRLVAQLMEMDVLPKAFAELAPILTTRAESAKQALNAHFKVTDGEEEATEQLPA